MIKKSLLFILIIMLSVGFAQQRKMEHLNEDEIDLKYLFYLPKDYYNAKKIAWPLILFLHGMGERGNDLESVSYTHLRAHET